MTRARRAALVAVAAIAALLAGCAEIPTSGTVQLGSTEGPNDTSIVFVPNPPAQGASPQEIVTGFLTAASAGGDFDVARQYLASSLTTRWRPGTRVLVQDAQPAITDNGDGNLTLEVPISARVDDRGVYRTSTTPQRLPFHLIKQAGQWRIDVAPDGIVLGEAVFQKVYAPRTLQFFDPTWKRLVPDVRWFPTAASPDAVVRALIAGPAGPVGGGVTVNALEGMKLGSVTSTGDVTTVVLGTAGSDPSPELTARMQQQLARTLPLPSPSALRLVANGRQVPPVKGLADQPTSLDAYVVADGRFGTIAPSGAFTEEPVLGPRIAALRPRDVTVSLSQRLAAVRTSSGSVAVVGATGESRVVDSRAGLVAPTLDQRGWTYSVPEDSPSVLRAFDAKGKPVDITADLGGATVTSIEVSPDGTRMLVLVQGARPIAYVAGIQRSPDGTPTGLTADRYQVALGDGEGIDATWVDTSSVAVLSRTLDNSTERVRVQQLGAGDQSLGELANAASITGTLNPAYLRVRLQNGDLWTWSSTIWQSQGPRPVDVSVLAVQR